MAVSVLPQFMMLKESQSVASKTFKLSFSQQNQYKLVCTTLYEPELLIQNPNQNISSGKSKLEKATFLICMYIWCYIHVNVHPIPQSVCANASRIEACIC